MQRVLVSVSPIVYTRILVSYLIGVCWYLPRFWHLYERPLPSRVVVRSHTKSFSSSMQMTRNFT